MEICKLYRKGNTLHSVVQTILQETGIDLTNGAEFHELIPSQEHFRDYKIIVYEILVCDNIIFESQFDSCKHLNLLYEDIDRNYHVIFKLTVAMARRYVRNACHKGCWSDVTHLCDMTRNDCIITLRARFPCYECNRNFRSRSCFAEHR